MATQTASNQITGKQLYEALDTARNPYVIRARRNAAITVPYLFPKQGSSAATNFEEPNQSLGARGVRNLASKLQLTLFPVNTPFFKYSVDDLALQALAKGQTDKRGEVEKALSARERAVINEMNASMFRPISFEACRQLVVSGNYLLFIPKKGRPRGFNLNQYVVQRDPEGNILDIVIKESIAKTALPEDLQRGLNADQAGADRDVKIDIYTKITLDETGKNYIVTQELDGNLLPTSQYSGTYPKDKLPWLPLRLTFIPGEDYGRAFVDEYIGDLTSLNVLVGALRDGTVQAAKVVWLIAPNATVTPIKLSRAANGEFVQAAHDSVKCLQMDKAADFSVAKQLIQELTERLSFGFLMNSAIQRNGERVTAEEIRYMAGELDQGLGGIYSLLSEEFQMPVATLYGLRMESVRKVPPLPKEISSTSIVTGLDALGRGNDLTNLDQFLAGAQQNFGPEVVKQYVNPSEYFKRRGASLGIDTGGLVYSDEELAQQQQAAQQQQLMTAAAPNAIAQAGGYMRDQQQQQADQQGQPTQ